MKTSLFLTSVLFLAISQTTLAQSGGGSGGPGAVAKSSSSKVTLKAEYNSSGVCIDQCRHNFFEKELGWDAPELEYLAFKDGDSLAASTRGQDFGKITPVHKGKCNSYEYLSSMKNSPEWFEFKLDAGSYIAEAREGYCYILMMSRKGLTIYSMFNVQKVAPGQSVTIDVAQSFYESYK